jgi:hypothetical protein
MRKWWNASTIWKTKTTISNSSNLWFGCFGLSFCVTVEWFDWPSTVASPSVSEPQPIDWNQRTRKLLLMERLTCNLWLNLRPMLRFVPRFPFVLRRLLWMEGVYSLLQKIVSPLSLGFSFIFVSLTFVKFQLHCCLWICRSVFLRLKLSEMQSERSWEPKKTNSKPYNANWTLRLIPPRNNCMLNWLFANNWQRRSRVWSVSCKPPLHLPICYRPRLRPLLPSLLSPTLQLVRVWCASVSCCSILTVDCQVCLCWWFCFLMCSCISSLKACSRGCTWLSSSSLASHNPCSPPTSSPSPSPSPSSCCSCCSCCSCSPCPCSSCAPTSSWT